MGKRITIQPHLSVAELKTRYLKAKDPVERSHYQIVWLMAQGKRTSEVALVTGYSSHWIRTLVRRYNQLGAAGLGDRRHNHPGGEPLLDDVQQAQLWQALHGFAPDGGLWNSRKVAEWISDRLDRPVAPQRGWDYLQQMGFRLCVPRPQHEAADYLEHAIWKKKLAAMVAQVQKDHPQAVVELWTMDEHRRSFEASAAASLGTDGGATHSTGALALPVAMGIWLCATGVRRELLVDSSQSEYQAV